MTDFAARYRAAYEALGVSLQSGDAVLEMELTIAEHRLDVRVPEALRQYTLLAGREAILNGAHNRLLSPRDWSVDDGHLVFLDENQSVVQWGVAVTGADDPPVHQRAGGEWFLEHDHCSEFLEVMLHWQAVMGGAEFMRSALDAEFPARLQGFRRAGAINELTAYSRDHVALCFVPWDDGPRIFVAGGNARAVQSLAEELSFEWDASFD